MVKQSDDLIEVSCKYTNMSISRQLRVISAMHSQGAQNLPWVMVGEDELRQRGLVRCHCGPDYRKPRGLMLGM